VSRNYGIVFLTVLPRENHEKYRCSYNFLFPVACDALLPLVVEELFPAVAVMEQDARHGATFNEL
jgi:hypothetical protein